VKVGFSVLGTAANRRDGAVAAGSPRAVLARGDAIAKARRASRLLTVLRNHVQLKPRASGCTSVGRRSPRIGLNLVCRRAS